MGGVASVGGGVSAGGLVAGGGTVSAGGVVAGGGTASTGGAVTGGGTVAAGGAATLGGDELVPLDPPPPQPARTSATRLAAIQVGLFIFRSPVLIDLGSHPIYGLY